MNGRHKLLPQKIKMKKMHIFKRFEVVNAPRLQQFPGQFRSRLESEGEAADTNTDVEVP